MKTGDKKRNLHKNTTLRKKAESQLKRDFIKGSPTKANSSFQGTENPLKLVQELQIHKIELEIQNEELQGSKEALEASITKYEDFYDFAPIGYFTFNKTGVILEVNLTGCTLLNKARSELVGTSFKRFTSSGSAREFDLMLRKVFEHNQKASGQLSVKPEGSEEIWIRIQISLPVDRSKCVAIVTDISDMIQAENELKRTKNYLEQLINYANAPIIVWDPSSEIILFNKAFERLTGYSSEEVIGKKLDILLPDPTIGKSKSMIKQTLYGDFLDSIEIPILCRNGDTKIVLWNSANIYGNDSNLISTIAQGNDITMRKKAETELEESQRKLDLALENGKIGIWEYDMKDQTITLDERMKKMTGIEDKIFDGTLSSFEKYIYEEDLVQVREAFRRTRENGDHFETIFRVKLAGQASKYLIAKGMLFKENGEPSKVTGVAIDITEMKKGSERALFKLNEELARSNKELEQFAYVASHDLQEPLRMVSTFTQMLAHRYGEKLDGNARDYIKYAVDGSKRMYDLINGLLAYSRIQTKVDYSDVDLNVILQEVLRNISLIAKTRNAEIKTAEMPVIRADRNQMLQLFQNLVSNSIKFSKGVPKVTISVEEHKDYYQFSVKDKGIGIDKQYHDRIFQIFQRLSTREEYEGTGIGLSICKRIVEKHGGKIWVKSAPGKGSTFMFTIKKEL